METRIEPQAAAPAAHPLIEDYLDHACVPLVGVAPYEKRQELRAEWRAHLLALVEAYRELGRSEEQAIPEALNQFGDPGKIGKQTARQLERFERGLPVPTRGSFLTALSCYAGATLYLWALITGFLGSPAASVHEPWVGHVGFSLGVLTGVISGLLIPARRGLSVAYGLAALIGIESSLGLLFGRFMSERTHELWTWTVIAQYVFWLPQGLVSAELTGWVRDRCAPVLKRWAPQ